MRRYAAGDRVVQAQYGAGTIVDVNEHHTVIEFDEHGTSLVFVRTKRGADKLARRLAQGGIKCAALHADRTQSERSAAVEGFKSGRFRALIATDIAARGIDIEGIGHVVNYEVPPSVDTYVHRVGRTGRAEAVGTALTLIAPEELAALRTIEKTLNVTFTVT